MTTEPLTAVSPDVVERLEPADVVVAATACATADAIERVTEAVRAACASGPAGARAVVVHAGPPGAADGPGPADAVVQLIGRPMPAIGRLPFSGSDSHSLFQPLSVVAERVRARACALVGTQGDAITVETIRGLTAAVLDRQIDLVLPLYPRHKFDGLINTGIVYPLTRALYGRRADGQLGVDFGLSPRLLAALAERPATAGSPRPVWPLTEAVSRGLEVAQACLGEWLPPVEQATDVSTALAQVLGSLFEDMEHHAATWQRVRGSQAVVMFGRRAAAPDEPRDVRAADMIESFRIGARNLQEVWARLLPPAIMVELNRLTRLSPEDFRVPDELWARIVFDFALGHRLRPISRDHLLRAMTPLYLAWVASFVRDAAALDPRGADDRVERLCLAFETTKPYLVARWRWPDRFSP